MVSSDCLSAIWLYVLLACFGLPVHGVPDAFHVPLFTAVASPSPLTRNPNHKLNGSAEYSRLANGTSASSPKSPMEQQR